MSFLKRENIALGLSAVAVFAAVGGPSWAASKIGSPQLKRGAVTNSKLARNAVTTSKIRNNSVLGSDVRNGTLTRADVATDFFNGLQTALTAGSLTGTFLAPNAITTDKIANGQVTGVKLDPGAVSTSRLLNNAVTSAKIDDDTIGSIDIARNGVTGSELDASGAAVLDFAPIAADSCGTASVAVTGVDVSDDAIVVTPPATFTGPLSLYPTGQTANGFSVAVCNLGTLPVEPDGTYRWVAITT